MQSSCQSEVFRSGDRGVQSELLEFFNIMSFNHNFIPLGGCCQWQSQLCNLHAVSNLLIAFAYYSIPACLIYCARQQANPPFNKSFVLLGACFFGGGTTHLMAVWTPPPANYLSWGSIEVVTAAISVWAAAKFVPLIPNFLARSATEKIAKNAVVSHKVNAADNVQKADDRLLENPTISSQTELLEIRDRLVGEIARCQQIEEQLQQANSRFHQLVTSSPIGIGCCDGGGKITEANSALLDIIGYTQEDLRSGKLDWQAIAQPTPANTDDRPDREQEKMGKIAKILLLLPFFLLPSSFFLLPSFLLPSAISEKQN
ncbi:MAG: PAS domain S-box protein [Microcoleus sp. SU_5_6]|nr:PAS domain S-box protein [Microcoleus sp. SU_5_6]